MKRQCLFLCVLAVFAIAISGTVAQKQKSDREDSRIIKLQQERLETLDHIVKLKTAGFRQGVVTVDEVIQSRLQLHDAQLDVAKTKNDRVQILTARLHHLRELEAMTQRRVAVGDAAEDQVLSVRAMRLKAEIELLTEENQS